MKEYKKPEHIGSVLRTHQKTKYKAWKVQLSSNSGKEEKVKTY